jgi:hypothetical protein
VSERELRYLWVLVSLNATESVQNVLLEGHPSWKYLQEVQTLLLNVQEDLMVSQSCCVRVCGSDRCGQGLWREEVSVWKVLTCLEGMGEMGDGCRKRSVRREEAAMMSNEWGGLGWEAGSA